MNENPNCTDCRLAYKCSHPCLPSVGEIDCKLAIYLDAPSAIEDKRGRSFVGDNAEFVKYCLARMSVSLDDVFLDYIVKCCPGKLPGKKADRMECVNACAQYRLAGLESLTQLKAICVLGSLGCETFLGVKSVGEVAGAEWQPASPFVKQFVPHVWAGYSSGLIREKPSEAGAIYRVIFMAAQEAGLNPEPNLKLKPYEIKTTR